MGLVAIRADASQAGGTGHVMRCLALAEAARAAAHDVVFLSAHLTDGLTERILQSGASLVPINADTASTDDAVLTAAWLADEGADALIVDGYDFTRDYRARVAQGNWRIMAIDDGCDHDLHADWVLNPSPLAHDLPYAQVSPAARLLLGAEYSLIRAEVRGYIDEERDLDSGHLVVVFGGSDPLALTVPVTIALAMAVPMAHLDVVLGAAAPNQEDMVEVAARFANAVTLHRQTPEIGRLLAGARMAVSAGGSTQGEVAALKVPAVLVTVAENQAASVLKAAEEGWAIAVDGRRDNAIAAISGAAGRLWLDRMTRQRMARVSQGLIDGRGATRAIAALLA